MALAIFAHKELRFINSTRVGSNLNVKHLQLKMQWVFTPPQINQRKHGELKENCCIPPKNEPIAIFSSLTCVVDTTMQPRIR